MNWLTRLFTPASPSEAAQERVLALEREAQHLRLVLAEREETAARLQSELERQRQSDEQRCEQAARSAQERLLEAAASPVAQLATQAHLLEAEGKPVQARDVLAVAKRLVQLLEDEGLTLEGASGATVPFDPNRHAPLAGPAPANGQAVVIRVPGVSSRGRILLKAGIEPNH